MSNIFIQKFKKENNNVFVNLPKQFTRHTMYKLLNRVIDNDLNPMDNEIIFDFSTLDFIEPAGITILSNLFEWLDKRGVNTMINIPDSIKNRAPIKFLDDSMFFERYINQNLTANPSIRNTTMPLALVSYENSYQWLDSYFTVWLSRQLNVNQVSVVNIKMCIGEIFNNIKDHAQENIGCVFAQHYPNLNHIKITISDFGIGIPNNIKLLRPSLQDHYAILLATDEGFTTRTSPRNLGAGLHTLIQNVVNDNKGSVHIHSNYGILDCINGYTGLVKVPTLKNAFYPGTFIEIVLRTDTIENIEEEEFEW